MQIAAYDDAQWRIDRIEKLLNTAVMTTGLSRVQLEAIIDEVRDHKGELIITWKHGDCTDRMKLCFSDAWRLCGEYNVHHNASGA
jgi:ribosomal silencing factor RsfS